MNKNKFLIIIIDLIAIAALFTLLIVALNHTNPNKAISINSPSGGSVINSPSQNKTNDTADSSKVVISNVSGNSSSENSVSEDSISDNSVSDNDTEPIYSYNLKGAPQIMNNPSGTVISISQINTGSLGDYFIISPIPDDIYDYINGKSFQENGSIKREELRYIKLLHYNYNHQLQIGELIVNEKIAKEVRDIFMALAGNGYEIQSMYLPDRYWTGNGNTTDSASCDANNTSAFFYRTVDGTTKLSNHASGMAIDINPQQNPYVSYSTGVPQCEHINAYDYIDRTTALPHMITTDDICYKLFTSYGYTWGGGWNTIKDYQHFEK